MKELDCFILKEDINPAIKAGMIGVILILYSKIDIEVEFVTPEGFNYEYNGQSTFTIKTGIIEIIK